MSSKCLLLTSLLLLLLLRVKGYSEALVSEASSEDDDSGPHVFVEKGNGYCDFNKAFGPVCNMTGSDDVVLTVQNSPEFMLRSHILEVEVHGASMVLLYPVCLPWVQLFNVRNMVTKQHQGKDGEDNSCRTWLRSYESHLGILNNNLKDLSLVNSTVDLIALHNLRDFLSLNSNVSVIQHLDWRGYAGLVRSSRIGNIISMQCNDNISMSDVVIEKIGWQGFTFAGRTMKINATSFGEVFSKGIHVVNGEAKFMNSVFEDLSIYGITVKPGATLKMQNVTIERCKKPCLVVPYSDSVEFQNVTIEGVSIEEMPGAVLYSGEDHADHGNFTLQTSQECQVDADNSQVIYCDFKNSNQTVFVTENDDYTIVTINHSSDFHIIGVCNLNLTLNNSTGLYTSNSGTTITTSASMTNISCTSGEDGGSLTATNTTFKGLDTQHLAQLTLKESSVHSLHTRVPLQQVQFRDSVMDVLWLMVSAEADWTDSEATIATASVGNLQASRMHFTKVVNLTIGDTGGNSTITDSIFEWCSIHGLTVTGSLVLTNVTFTQSSALPIFLAEGARLYLQDVTFPNHRTQHVISAASPEQVVWQKANATSELVYVRSSEDDTEQVSIVGDRPCRMIFRLGANPYRFDPTLTCDYNGTNAGNNVVMRELVGNVLTRSVVITAARNLSLENICSRSITVTDTEMVTMDEVDRVCRYNLVGFGSTFATITNQPDEVSLYESKAFIIESSATMQELILVHSSVQSVSTSVQTVTSFGSNITHISYLEVFGSAHFNQSSLGTIDSLRLYSNGSIVNCTISILRVGAIQVNDKLLIANVTIRSMNLKSIIINGIGHLVMSNVIIEKGSIDSFKFSLGSLTLNNVTLNGYPLIENDIIKINDTTSTQVPVTPAPTTSPTTHAAPTTLTVSPTSPVLPPQTSTEDGFAPLDPNHRSGGGEAGGGGGIQPWQRWASVGAAIFFTLLLVLIILSVALVVRAHRRGQPLLPALSDLFGRRGNSDRNFLSTEMEPTIRDPSSTHYVRLPL